MDTETLLTGHAAIYRRAAKLLTAIKSERFPVGSAAIHQVNGVIRHIGFVATYDCSPDQLALRLENGNTWWYPVEECQPITRKEYAPWMLRELRSNAAKKAARTRRGK